MVLNLLAFLLYHPFQSSIYLTNCVHQGSNNTLQALLSYQIFILELIYFILELRDFFFFFLPVLFELILDLSEFFHQFFNLFFQCLIFGFFFLLNSDSVFLEVSLQIFHINCLFLQFFFQLCDPLLQLGIFCSQFAVSFLEVAHRLNNSVLFMNSAFFLFFSAMGLLKEFFQYLFFIPELFNYILLLIQAFLKLIVLLFFGIVLKSFLCRFGHLHNLFLVLLNDLILLLDLTLIVTLDFDLILLQFQDFIRPLFQLLLQTLNVLPALCQFCRNQLQFLLHSLIFCSQSKELCFSLQTLLPLDFRFIVQELYRIPGTIAFLGLKQMIQFSYFFFQLSVLLSCVLFEFDLFMEDSLFVTEIAHTIDKSLKDGLKLADAIFLLLVQDIDDPGTILLVYFLFKEVIFLLRQLQCIVEFFVLTFHFLPNKLKKFSTMFPSLAKVDGRNIFLIFFDCLQFFDAPFKELNFFYATQVLLSLSLIQSVLQSLEKPNHAEYRPDF